MSYKLIGLLLLIFAILFYWFQIRPSQIKSECSASSIESAKSVVKTRAEIYHQDYELTQAAARDLYYPSDYNSYYKRCLTENGL